MLVAMRKRAEEDPWFRPAAGRPALRSVIYYTRFGPYNEPPEDTSTACVVRDFRRVTPLMINAVSNAPAVLGGSAGLLRDRRAMIN